MQRTLEYCAGCSIVLVIWASIGAVTGLLLEWAWNLVVPLLFHGPTITYTVACAMYFLASLLCALLRSK